MTTVFECTRVGGQPRPDEEETVAVAYWSLAKAMALPLAAWLMPVLPQFYERTPAVDFEPAHWQPPDI